MLLTRRRRSWRTGRVRGGRASVSTPAISSFMRYLINKGIKKALLLKKNPKQFAREGRDRIVVSSLFGGQYFVCQSLS
jgi:hypothetical protein